MDMDKVVWLPTACSKTDSGLAQLGPTVQDEVG